MPGYFNILAAGGNDVQNVNMTVYDALGGAHTLNAALVQSDTPNTWDMVITSVTGDVSGLTNRRIDGITFNSDGAYNGLASDSQTEFGIQFGQNSSTTQNIGVAFGTAGQYDGITQLAGSSTAVVNTQDGYASGQLSSLAVNQDGTLVGTFSNGIKENIATIQMATFRNPEGLQGTGNGYFVTSGNSGNAITMQAATGGIGTIQGGSLEKSNADVATEFANMIEAQNSYQANARTISVANTILGTLTNLLR
jgi:flagellar hook protein FlgE